jgi:hypothetical protein
MNSEPVTLSSAQTFIMKVPFPILWIGGFATATFAFFFFPDSWVASSGEAPDLGQKWFFLFATIIGGTFIWWSCVRLKRVRMDNQALYISNYQREIIVPLANVADVTENRWVNIHPVTIHFHSETEFGNQVVFMPKTRWFGFWSSHPVVEQIRQAVDRATGRDRITFAD